MIQIDVLPDDVLLEIFDSYMHSFPSYSSRTATDHWHPLVHVCQRWRNVVLESPRRLDLELFCTPKTSIRDTLDIWPALPLVIEGNMTSSGMENVIATLGQSNRDRVYQVHLEGLAGWQLEQVLAAMQVPFPELDTLDLRLTVDNETPPVIPDSFLGGSAPQVQFFYLNGIPYPGLLKLRFSATHLFHLELYNIPVSGYISPEAVVTLISVLSCLERLALGFESPPSRPGHVHQTRRPPPSNRFIIPALRHFYFNGAIDYLEDLVTCIDTPQLYDAQITFIDQIVYESFDAPRLSQFINRTPKLGKRDRDVTVQFDDDFARVQLSAGILKIAILCSEPNWQLSSIKRVCNSSLHPLSTAEDLYIEHQYLQLVWKNDAIKKTLWLQLLLVFTSVKNLYLSKEAAPGTAAALQELEGDRITEIFPCLQNIFVRELEPSGPFQERIGQFVAARQLSGRPITISNWNKFQSRKLQPFHSCFHSHSYCIALATKKELAVAELA